MIEEIVPAKSSWSGIVKKGQRLKITDLKGQQLSTSCVITITIDQIATLLPTINVIFIQSSYR